MSLRASQTLLFLFDVYPGVCSKHNHTSHKEPLLPPSSSRLVCCKLQIIAATLKFLFVYKVRRQGSMPRIVEWVLVNDYSQVCSYSTGWLVQVCFILQCWIAVPSIWWKFNCSSSQRLGDCQSCGQCKCELVEHGLMVGKKLELKYKGINIRGSTMISRCQNIIRGYYLRVN